MKGYLPHTVMGVVFSGCQDAEGEYGAQKEGEGRGYFEATKEKN